MTASPANLSVKLPVKSVVKLAVIVAFILGLVVAMSPASLLWAQSNGQSNAHKEKNVPRAMRAPLNIIPPPLQQTIAALSRNNAKNAKKNNATKARRGGGQNLLAPRAAAKQMKRARRSVASVPGSATGVVQVGQLGALEDAPVGLETGYGQNVWRGARLAFVTDTMARLPKNHNLTALRDMELRLHRGIASAPLGTVRGTSWFASRLNRLVVLNDAQGALQLAGLTVAATHDAYTARAVIEAHLALGDTKAACAVATPARRRGRAIKLFFLERLIMCDLANGQYDKAALAVELNPILQDDKFFHDVAFALAARASVQFVTELPKKSSAKEARNSQLSDSQAPAPIIIPAKLTIMHFAVLDLIPDKMPDDLRAIPTAMRGRLAEDYRVAAELQLTAAFLAVKNGRIDGRKFEQISQRVDMDALKAANIIIEQSENSETAKNERGEATITPNYKPTYQTPLQQAVFLITQQHQIDASPPDNQPNLIADTLSQAFDGGFWAAAVRVLYPRLHNLRIDETKTTPDQRALLLAAYWAGNDMAPQIIIDDVNAQSFGPIGELAVFPEIPEINKLSVATLNLPNMGFVNMLASPQKIFLLMADDPISRRLHKLVQMDDITLSTPDRWVQATNDEAQIGAGILPVLANNNLAIDWLDYEAQLGNDSAIADYLRMEFAVLFGLGLPVPDNLATQIIDSAVIDAEEGRLEKLVENQWTGDLILALVANYGRQNALDFAPRETAHLLTILRSAGLTKEAYALARDILLPHYVRLILVRPTLFITKPAFIEKNDNG